MTRGASPSFLYLYINTMQKQTYSKVVYVVVFVCHTSPSWTWNSLRTCHSQHFTLFLFSVYIYMYIYIFPKETENSLWTYAWLFRETFSTCLLWFHYHLWVDMRAFIYKDSREFNLYHIVQMNYNYSFIASFRST